jgi:demethylmenaquinone methyltransferase/2-methoxy-6-polyprenyl-1,4-benzoquinol methylase
MAKSGQAQVIGCDFSHPMLRQCSEKILKRNLNDRIRIAEADALNLPFRDQTFDAAAIAFGLRNLDSVKAGLAEMGRVLKPGGKLIVLEFSRPTHPLFEKLFSAYFFRVLPRIGNRISRHKYAYTYLPASVSQFPHQAELTRILANSGLIKPGYFNLSGGIAAIHYGEKK